MSLNKFAIPCADTFGRDSAPKIAQCTWIPRIRPGSDDGSHMRL